jgi:hypothetical protein
MPYVFGWSDSGLPHCMCRIIEREERVVPALLDAIHVSLSTKSRFKAGYTKFLA